MKLRPFYLFLALSCSVLFVWLAYPRLLGTFLAHQIVPSGSWAARGIVGDSFGALNTLFTGIGLAGIVVNIYLQSIQLKKLEDREAENERQLRAQAQAIRDTALLAYYNSEIDRLDKYAIEVESAANVEQAGRFWSRIETLRTSRDKIVQTILTAHGD